MNSPDAEAQLGHRCGRRQQEGNARALHSQGCPRLPRHCVIDQRYCFFMDLQHGYFYTANSRLTLYADESRWAIVFKKNGYANRALRVEIELNFFGNCLHNLDRAGAEYRYVCNAKWVMLVDGDDLDEIASHFEQVSLSATSVKVRGKHVQLPSTKERYATWVPNIHADNGYCERPTYQDLARFQAQHRNPSTLGGFFVSFSF